jgi:ferredoxin-NADP reductase
MVHKDQHIQIIVKSVTRETPNHLTLRFDRPRNFTFEAGDWIDIEFEGKTLVGGKTYSLSSSPSEADLAITFKEGMSPLKKALATAEKGELVNITQYGNDYGFQLSKTKASTLIAGGVGVAPFRSMLKEIADEHLKIDVELIFLNQTQDFLFAHELADWESKLAGLTVHYIQTSELKRKQRQALMKTLITDASRHFYVAGPPGMVVTTTSFLSDFGVPERYIKVDSFGGY